MDYQYLTADEQSDIFAKALKAREQEFFYYELNRLNYAQMLDTQFADLAPEWPAEIAQFKTLDQKQLADVLTGDQLQLAGRLKFRDQVQKLLATTLLEQAKCEAAYTALRGNALKVVGVALPVLAAQPAQNLQTASGNPSA